MKYLSFFLLAGATAALDDYQDLGGSCVEPLLKTLFEDINALRRDNVYAPAYFDYLSLKYADGTGANPTTTPDYDADIFPLAQNNYDQSTVDKIQIV